MARPAGDATWSADGAHYATCLPDRLVLLCVSPLVTAIDVARLLAPKTLTANDQTP
jgi:hypothetical protein